MQQGAEVRQIRNLSPAVVAKARTVVQGILQRQQIAVGRIDKLAAFTHGICHRQHIAALIVGVGGRIAQGIGFA